MKRLVPLLILGVVAGLATAAFVRLGCCDAGLAHSAGCGDTRCWFRVEFGLDAKTIDAIEASQKRFAVECAGHCRVVAEAEAALKKLPSDASDAERAAAREAVAAADRACRTAREEHVRRIAALMPAAEGKRYLDIVSPRLAKHGHSSIPDASGR